MLSTNFGFMFFILFNFFFNQIIQIQDIESKYISEKVFRPDFGLINREFERQIYDKQIYCEISFLLSKSFTDKFHSIQDAQKFVLIAIQYVNLILERQFSWKPNHPMFLYKVKSMLDIPEKSFLLKYLDRPEKLLEKLNEYVLLRQNNYCQTVLLTSENWGDILGVAYQDNPITPQNNLCNSPSAFVLTSLMKGRFINQATLAYLFAHEAAHTLCADHDPMINVNNYFQIKKINLTNKTKISANFLKNYAAQYFIMDSGTGMIPNEVLPQFSKSTINIVAQCMFIKGRNCLKKMSFAMCGNGITEYGEECDAINKCCEPPGSLRECQFTRGSVCSSNEPCCTNECQFKNSTVLCYDGDECSQTSYCNGKTSQCNLNYSNIDQFRECNNGRALCLNGKCKDSICKKFNQEACHPYGDDACLIKCYDEKKSNCRVIMDKERAKPLFLPNGWKCGSSLQGRCINGICKEVLLFPTHYEISAGKMAIFSIILVVIAIAGISLGGYTVYRISTSRTRIYISDD